MAQHSDPITSLLLVPGGTANPKSGAGQRTAIFFRALKQMGPVDVVILNDRKRDSIREFFPGAHSVQYAHSTRISATPKKGVDWLRYNLSRFLWVQRLYNPEPGTADALSGIMNDAHKVIVSRYAQPFCISGVEGNADHHVFIDIDDRDDQKFLTASQAVLVTGLAGRLFEKWVVPAVRQQLLRRLQSARLLWYAASEDDLGVDGPDVGVLRNVPFDVRPVPGAPAASAKTDVLFVGSSQHRPNQDGVRWFLNECWPALERKHP